jgi:DDE_Tnp_1-associated/Transposase DDE domain
MPALSSLPIHPVVAHLAAAADSDRLAGAGVMAALAKVPDPRARRGVRHQISAILTLAACAVLAGCRSFTAIGEWVANASDQVLAALQVDGCPPCESTIRRTLQRLDGDELDVAIGGWAAVHTKPPAGRRRVVALDGKTVRGSAGDAVDARHLLAAIDHRSAVVLGQVNVARKTNEIPMFPVLCDRIDDLEEAVITADALPAQRSHADYLVLQRRAH